MSPLLPLHISAGIVGILSGAAAMSFRKGSARHALAGKVFVIAMLTLAASAVYLALMKHQLGNVLGGTFTFYLVATAWMTARRGDGETGIFDWVAMLIPLLVGTALWILGLEVVYGHAKSPAGVPVGMYFFMGSVMLLAAAGDIRMLVRGGVFGAKRIVRHLWRMCFGLFIAAGSFFLAPSNRPLRLLSAVGLGQHLPPALFSTTLYLILTILPLILLVFWVVRVRFTKAYNGKSMIPGR